MNSHLRAPLRCLFLSQDTVLVLLLLLLFGGSGTPWAYLRLADSVRRFVAVCLHLQRERVIDLLLYRRAEHYASTRRGSERVGGLASPARRCPFGAGCLVYVGGFGCIWLSKTGARSPVMHVRHTGPGNQCNDARSREVPESVPTKKITFRWFELTNQCENTAKPCMREDVWRK